MLTTTLNCGIVNSGDIMITYNEFAKLFVGISNDDFCIEINFCVGDKEEYQNCWMGKNKKDKRETFWFGLKEDGSEAYDYEDFTAFSSAQVFNGKSLKEIWSDIELLSIDGCEPEKIIKEYLK